MSRVSGKPYLLYILWSSSAERFYVGVTEEVDHRLSQHNSDEGRGWTKRHRPWRLVHTEEYETFGDARRRELQLKAQKGGAGFFLKTGLDAAAFGRRS